MDNIPFGYLFEMAVVLSLAITGACLLVVLYSSLDICLLRQLTRFSLRTMFAAQTLIVIALITLRAMGVEADSLFGTLFGLTVVASFWFVLYSVIKMLLQDLFASESNMQTLHHPLPKTVSIDYPHQDAPLESTKVNFDFLTHTESEDL